MVVSRCQDCVLLVQCQYLDEVYGLWLWFCGSLKWIFEIGVAISGMRCDEAKHDTLHSTQTRFLLFDNYDLPSFYKAGGHPKDTKVCFDGWLSVLAIRGSRAEKRDLTER